MKSARLRNRQEREKKGVQVRVRASRETKCLEREGEGKEGRVKRKEGEERVSRKKSTRWSLL